MIVILSLLVQICLFLCLIFVIFKHIVRMMIDSVSYRKKCIIIFSVIILTVGGFVSYERYQNYQITQKLLQEEIYKLCEEFLPNGYSKTVYGFYMVCAPEDEDEKFLKQIARFIEEKKLLESARTFYREECTRNYNFSVDEIGIKLIFYKPSDKYPVGWDIYKKRYIDYGYIISVLRYNRKKSIAFPWNAESLSDSLWIDQEGGLEDQNEKTIVKRSIIILIFLAIATVPIGISLLNRKSNSELYADDEQIKMFLSECSRAYGREFKLATREIENKLYGVWKAGTQLHGLQARDSEEMDFNEERLL